MNNISLVGRLGSDPELRYTPSGKAVSSFRIAVDRGYGDKRETDWIPITAFDSSAEFAANHLGKGRLVSVEGRLQSRQWEDKEGKKRTNYDVVARNITALGPKPADTPESRQTQSGAPEPAADPTPVSVCRPAPDHDPNDPFAEEN